jgi:hypothetical protein
MLIESNSCKYLIIEASIFGQSVSWSDNSVINDSIVTQIELCKWYKYSSQFVVSLFIFITNRRFEQEIFDKERKWMIKTTKSYWSRYCFFRRSDMVSLSSSVKDLFRLISICFISLVSSTNIFTVSVSRLQFSGDLSVEIYFASLLDSCVKRSDWTFWYYANLLRKRNHC